MIARESYWQGFLMFRKKKKPGKLAQRLIDEGFNHKTYAGSRFLYFLDKKGYDDNSRIACWGKSVSLKLPIASINDGVEYTVFDTSSERALFFDYYYENEGKLDSIMILERHEIYGEFFPLEKISNV